MEGRLDRHPPAAYNCFVSPSVALASAPSRHPRRWPQVSGGIVLLLAALGLCEAIGWPFLAEPVQSWLSSALQRPVDLAIDGHTPASVRVRLLGRLRIEAPLIKIGPAAAPTLSARDAVIELSYADLWRASRGGRIEIRSLRAADAEVNKQQAHVDVGLTM
jgi:AsmA family protein